MDNRLYWKNSEEGNYLLQNGILWKIGAYQGDFGILLVKVIWRK